MEVVHPEYDGKSVANISPTILKHFGCEPQAPINPSLESRLSGAKKVVFFFIDGLGWDQMTADLRHMPFLDSLLPEGCQITAAFPSTTAVTVASLGSGLTPQQHGILGFTLYLSEFNSLTNMLRYTKDCSFELVAIEPEKFFPFKTVGEQLSEKGIGSHSLLTNDITHTPFSDMVLRGTTQEGYDTLDEFFPTVEGLLKRDGQQFIHAYVPTYDKLCHEHGPDGQKAKEFLHELDKQLWKFMLETTTKDTLFFLTADHGHIKIPREKQVCYQRHPDLTDALKAIGSEARVNYFYCKEGQQGFVQDYFAKHLSGFGTMLKTDDAISQGLFGRGALYEKSRERLGDFIVIAKDDYALVTRPSHMIGMHGGLSHNEMVLPLLMWQR